MKKLLTTALLLLLALSLRAGFLDGCPYNPMILPVAVDTTGINKYDKEGRKIGLWKEINPYYILFNNYANGQLDGVAVTYSWYDVPDGCYFLSEVGFYKEGKRHGAVYYFYPSGHISFYIVNLEDFSGSEFYTLKGYAYQYNEDGTLACEGWCLYGEEILIDDERIGIWKFYNTDGSFYEKDFGDGEWKALR